MDTRNESSSLAGAPDDAPDAEKYDGWEISKVKKLHTAAGTFCEAIDSPECEDDLQPGETLIRTFWTIYGHMSGEGTEAICDCDEREDAFKILGRILGVDMLCEIREGTTRYFFDENGNA